MRTLFAEQQYLSIASKQFVEMIQLTGDGDAAVFNAIHTNIFSMKKIQELNANTVFLEPCYPVPGSTKSSFRNNLQYFKLNKKQDRISAILFAFKGLKEIKEKMYKLTVCCMKKREKKLVQSVWCGVSSDHWPRITLDSNVRKNIFRKIAYYTVNEQKAWNACGCELQRTKLAWILLFPKVKQARKFKLKNNNSNRIHIQNCTILCVIGFLLWSSTIIFCG